MRNIRNILKFAFFIVLAFVLTACGSSNDDNTTSGSEGAEQVEDKQTNEEESVEREQLELAFEVKVYDAENNVLNVSYEANLPNDTVIYRAVLKDEEGKSQLIEYEVTVDEAQEIAFSLEGIDKEALVNKEYHLVFEFNVTEKTNSNLFEDKSLGGSFAEMDEAYSDSDQVVVTDLGVDDAYTISLMSSNTNPIAAEKFEEESASE
ncbi:hypothetical protein GMD78_18480 [Ornithinibacillus sp. L9]|uniref:Lipoprotein n=1 Tax=Ornithinibacillus caprae TaxID=2678566 RepID=A0A6N8FP52_9BACI|nr:hypothetical protein [Ornithinibacillus caprae]MUK90364.1 hypothetical protein [Ornithinibacillus caprae]